MQLEGTVLTLKSLSDTRWPSRKQATEAVITSLPAILVALERVRAHIITFPKVASETDGLLQKLESVNALFLELYTAEDICVVQLSAERVPERLHSCTTDQLLCSTAEGDAHRSVFRRLG